MKKNFKILITTILLLFIFVVPKNTTNMNVSAAKEPTISTKEDFFKALSKQIYDRTLNKKYNLEGYIQDWVVNGNYYEEYFYHYDSENPFQSGCYLRNYLSEIRGNYWLSGNEFVGEVSIRISFPYPKATMDRHFEMMSELAESLKGKNDYETVLNVHDYLIENFDYDYRVTSKNYTDIDGFKDGLMVCDGYAMATYYLCNKAGVETRLILGIANNDTVENHAWNVVKINGKWYNMDVTWDDKGGNDKSYDYFLKSDADFPGHIRSNNYNSSNFGIEISKTSYTTTSYKKYILWILVFLIAYICIRTIIKNKSKASPVISVVDKNQCRVGTMREDDFEKWLNENHNNSTTA